MPDPKKKLPDVKTFFTDPANQEDADFFRGVFDHLLQERAAKEAEEREASGGNKTFLQRLFDGE